MPHLLSKIVNLLLSVAASGDEAVARSFWSSSRRWTRKRSLSNRNKEEAGEAQVKTMWKGPRPQGKLRNLAKSKQLLVSPSDGDPLLPLLFKHLDSLPFTSVATYSQNEVLCQSCYTFKNKLQKRKKEKKIHTVGLLILSLLPLIQPLLP